MKTQTLRVSLGFAGASDSRLVNSSEIVLTNLYEQAAFPEPPVTSAALLDALNIFIASMAAMKNGGPASTATKNNKRESLITLMKELAFYVQMASANNLATLLSSGFEAVSTNRGQEVLLAPASLRIKNGSLNQSLTTVEIVRNSRGYEMQYAPVDDAGTAGQWMDVPFSTSSRNIPVNDLTSGKQYIYRARAMGGLTGQSDWSESVSHRAY